MRFLCWLTFALLAPPVFLLWLETILFWQTPKGLMGSTVILCCLIVATASLLGWQFPSAGRRVFIVDFSAALLGVALLIYLAATAPTNSGPGIQRHNPDPPRLHPLNLIPEVDQVSWGLALSRHLGVLPNRLQERLDKSVLELYKSPLIQHLGSSTVYTWSNLWGGNYGRGDCLYFVPDGAEKAPVLLFLHGSLGNFHSHLVVLQELCEKQGYILVSPSFGAGNWNNPLAVEAIDEAFQFATHELPADPDRIVLVSLSNGTQGALDAARRWPDRFRGICSISGRVSGEKPAIPVVLLHGKDDRLVNYERAAKWANEQSIEMITFPEHDHSLFYAGRMQVLESIGAWIGERISEKLSSEG